MKTVIRLLVGLAMFGASLVSAEACSVCMGGAGSSLGEAANGAIFVMLGVLGGVLGLIVMAGYSVVKRAQLPLPPHAELARSISNSNLN